MKSSIYGVKFNYTELPSAENPYPEVYIRVMPWIYGSGSSSVDEEIENTIEESALFKQVKANNLYESNRLMYVGMTRPQDVMILALERPAKNCHELQWLKEIGLESVNPQAESDLLGVGCPFKNDTLSSQQLDTFENFRYKSLDEKLKTNCIPYHQPLCEEDRKYVSPSSLHETGEMVNTRDAMTATIEEIPYPLLHHITQRIITEVPGVNRVLYDLTPKPTGTIEWE